MSIESLLVLSKSVLFFRLHSVPTNYVVEFFLFFIIFFVGVATRSYFNWLTSEKIKKEIESEKTAAELQNLKNQLNPHFLFNSLNSIYSLTLKKSEKSSEAIIMLSELMRYMLYETNETYVFLQKEIDFIQNYFALQKLQIANNNKVELNIRGDFSQQIISPLLLIPFIENAFKYSTSLSGETSIKISIELTNNEFLFKCKNSIGNRNNSSNKNSGIGLKNTINRLKLMYNGHYELDINEENSMYNVELRLTLNQRQEL